MFRASSDINVSPQTDAAGAFLERVHMAEQLQANLAWPRSPSWSILKDPAAWGALELFSGLTNPSDEQMSQMKWKQNIVCPAVPWAVEGVVVVEG